MDYFIHPDKTYVKAYAGEFPIDPVNYRACIRGSGNEPQAWTTSRDVGKALVELLASPEWVSAIQILLADYYDLQRPIFRHTHWTLQEPITYVAGEWSTFNKAVELMEAFYGTMMIHFNPSTT